MADNNDRLAAQSMIPLFCVVGIDAISMGVDFAFAAVLFTAFRCKCL